MAERRLIDETPRPDEPALTTHLRQIAAPVPLNAAARARIAAALHAARPEPRSVAVWLALAGTLAATVALLFVPRHHPDEPMRIAAPAAVHVEPAETAPVVVEPDAPPAIVPVKRRADNKPLWLSEGTMVVRAGNHARTVDTPLGKLMVRQGSVVEIKVRASRVQVAAWRGSASFDDGAQTVEIRAGVAWTSDSAQALELLAQAIGKLRRDHDPDGALALLASYRQLSDGELSQEAGLVEAEALLAAGREEQALRALEGLSLDGRADLSSARERLRKKLSGPTAP